MIFRTFGMGLLVLWGSSAAALTFESCRKEQIEIVTGAVDGAGALAEAAAAQIADTETYRAWFGRYSARTAEPVRQNLLATVAAIRSGQIHTYCGDPNEDGCKGDTYAYVYSDEPFTITLCPPFFTMPAMFEEDPTSDIMDNGTQEGTIIHELTHFDIIGGTDDLCYSRTACRQMALEDPAGARINADSFQYFAEDVGFGPVVVKAAIPTGRMRF
jgi:peptidyl-Lys metalloendopeptidase